MIRTQTNKKGFTLLELLIVITILSILTLVVVLFINPVEMLKKSRDVQRMSDLATVKSAIILHLQNSASNNLGGTAHCVQTAATDSSGGKISMSLITTGTPGNKVGTDTGAGCTTSCNASSTTATLAYKNDATGWIPFINFTLFASGAPIDRLPVDPTNNTAGGTAGAAGVDSLYYRYACRVNNTFELDATLESDAYKFGGAEPKAGIDGGNSPMRYEVGTDLNILPSSAPVFATPLT